MSPWSVFGVIGNKIELQGLEFNELETAGGPSLAFVQANLSYLSVLYDLREL